jgi:hypothetical protein
VLHLVLGFVLHRMDAVTHRESLLVWMAKV